MNKTAAWIGGGAAVVVLAAGFFAIGADWGPLQDADAEVESAASVTYYLDISSTYDDLSVVTQDDTYPATDYSVPAQDAALWGGAFGCTTGSFDECQIMVLAGPDGDQSPYAWVQSQNPLGYVTTGGDPATADWNYAFTASMTLGGDDMGDLVIGQYQQDGTTYYYMGGVGFPWTGGADTLNQGEGGLQVCNANGQGNAAFVINDIAEGSCP